MFHKLIRNGDGSAKNNAASHNLSFGHQPTTIINLATEASTPGPEKPSAISTRPTIKRSVGWASNLFTPSRSKPQNSKLKLGPSGAIVFKPFESQESVVSTLRPVSGILSDQVANVSVPSSPPTTVHDKYRSTGPLRSSSQDSFLSVPASLPRRRSSENYQPRVSNFLGRHPPPIQRRSTSLPPTPLSRIPERLRAPTPERELLFIGGHTEPTSPIFTKIPRFVPLEIRRANVNMPHCLADCSCSVEKDGDFCPEHEDQFSTTCTRGSIMRSFIENDVGHQRSLTPSIKEKGASPGLIANFKGIFGKKNKEEGERPNYDEKKSKDQADNTGANGGG